MHKKFRLALLVVLIIGSLVLNAFLGVAVIALGDELYEKDKTISELNQGAEIDLKYVNAVSDYNQTTYDLMSVYMETTKKLIKGTLSSQEEEQIASRIETLSQTLEDRGKTIKEIKEERTQLFKGFQFAKVYTP